MTISAVDIALLVCGGATALLLIWPRLARASLWRATITPLASIIGSGFLILGPVLVDSFGSYALAAMAALCLAGYGFGAAIRYNIARIAAGDPVPPAIEKGERAASWALAFAYVISVAYYLNLLGAFAARIAPHPPPEAARAITTLVYLVILVAGMTRGFSLLERMEQASVTLKLAIIAALLGALAMHTLFDSRHGMMIASGSKLGPFASATLLFGMIVTVQGFETSRYLGAEYGARERIVSMRLAQVISTAIYLIYVALLSLNFDSGSFRLSETAIIDLMRSVSAVLGPLLIVAALSAQFSAAVADTGGSGGLVHELTHGLVDPRRGYLLLVVIGLALTWTADVFQIVSYASRAFAAYYAAQSALAAWRLHRHADRTAAWRMKLAGFSVLAVVAALAAIFGRSAEG